MSGLTDFRHENLLDGSTLPDRPAIVVNYSALSDSAWPHALDALCRIMPN